MTTSAAMWTSPRGELIQALERVTRERDKWRGQAADHAADADDARAELARAQRLLARHERAAAARRKAADAEAARVRRLHDTYAAGSTPVDPNAHLHVARLLAALDAPPDTETKAG